MNIVFIAIAVVLFIIGFIFAGNGVKSLIGGYGSVNKWRNVLLAGCFATLAIWGGVCLIA